VFFETDFSKHTVLWTTVGMRSLSIIYRRLAKLGIKIDDSCAVLCCAGRSPGGKSKPRAPIEQRNTHRLATWQLQYVKKCSIASLN